MRKSFNSHSLPEAMQKMDTLEEGIAAAKAGHKKKAQAALQKVLKQEPRNEKAWLWLATLMPTPEDAIICLENVLKINPSNHQAQKGLKKLTARLEARPKKRTGQEIEPAKPGGQEVEPAEIGEAPEEPIAMTGYMPYTPERLEAEMLSWLELADYFYRKGQTRRQMEDSLAKKGLDRRLAVITIEEFFKLRRSGGIKKMVHGGLGCLGGLVVTTATILLTFQIGFGIIVVAWGAMFFGFVWFLGGLIQFFMALWSH